MTRRIVAYRALVPQALSAADSAVLSRGLRRRRRAGAQPPQSTAVSTRSSSPRPSAPSGCRTSPSPSPPSTPTRSRCAASADRRHREVRPGPVARAARARRHDDRVPRRRELRHRSSAPSPRPRSTSTSSRSRRAAATRIRASSTSSASRRCADRRGRCTARARSPARCASSPTSRTRPGFDAWAEAQVTEHRRRRHRLRRQRDGQYPLAADRLALRLVGFTSEDAGFIDNVLSDSQGGTFDNCGRVDEDVNDDRDEWRPRGAALGRHRDVDVTLGAIFQDVKADGHGDVNRAPATSTRSGSRTRASTTSGTRRR